MADISGGCDIPPTHGWKIVSRPIARIFHGGCIPQEQGPNN